MGGKPILTDVRIRRTQPPTSGRVVLHDGLVAGLSVRITPTGRRTFGWVGRRHGRFLRVTFGVWPTLSLAQARVLARAAAFEIASGRDPRAAKRRAAVIAAEPTVADAVHDYLERHARLHKRERTWKADARTFEADVLPIWGTRPLRSITRRDVVALTDAIARRAPISANRTLARIGAFLAWSMDKGLVDTNVAARLRAPSPERPRSRVLDDSEIARLWPVWSELGWPHGYALMVLLLTGCRRGEVAGMRWAELDLDGPVPLWTIDASRTKGNRTHLVPLVGLALELLRRVPQLYGSPLVFPGRTPDRPIASWDRMTKRSSARAGVHGWRVHDLRRSCRSALSRLGTPLDVAEATIGHVRTGVVGVYDLWDRLPERRDALTRWSAHVESLVGSA